MIKLQIEIDEIDYEKIAKQAAVATLKESLYKDEDSEKSKEMMEYCTKAVQAAVRTFPEEKLDELLEQVVTKYENPIVKKINIFLNKFFGKKQEGAKDIVKISKIYVSEE